MPRKNARPAARKALAKKRAAAKAPKPRRVIALTHGNGLSAATLALMYAAMDKMDRTP